MSKAMTMTRGEIPLDRIAAGIVHNHAAQGSFQIPPAMDTAIAKMSADRVTAPFFSGPLAIMSAEISAVADARNQPLGPGQAPAANVSTRQTASVTSGRKGPTAFQPV